MCYCIVGSSVPSCSFPSWLSKYSSNNSNSSNSNSSSRRRKKKRRQKTKWRSLHGDIVIKYYNSTKLLQLNYTVLINFTFFRCDSNSSRLTLLESPSASSSLWRKRAEKAATATTRATTRTTTKSILTWMSCQRRESENRFVVYVTRGW